MVVLRLKRNMATFAERWNLTLAKVYAQNRSLPGREEPILMAPGNTTSMGVGETNGLYLINEGFLKLVMVHRQAERAIRICGPNDMVGYASWLIDEGSYKLIALSRTQLTRYPKDLLFELQRSSPEVMDLVAEAVGRIILLKDQRIIALESASALSRVCSLIYSLAKKFGRRTQEGILIDVEVDKGSMAQLAGLAPQSLSRTLTELEEMDLIRRRRRKLVVNNLKEIKDLMK